MTAPIDHIHVHPHLSAAVEGRIVVPRCMECRRVSEIAAPACTWCGHPHLYWIEVEPRGTLVTWAVHHQRISSADSRPERAVCIVELSNGPWIFARLELTAIKYVAVGAVVDLNLRPGELVPVVSLMPASEVGAKS